ncbi:hypothetical protein BH739_16400 [Enterococcus casseliflavus]|nr:hypothetical protein BH739_16400 [Enterococcus casseliflavus]
MTNETNTLTTLMKQKYGVSKSSPLKFTPKDNLFTKFRKLAMYIYKNGDWTTEDELRAVSTLLRKRR